MIAAPAPWRERATSSPTKSIAMTPIAVPSVKRLIEITKTTRADIRCRRKPVVGMTIAIASMKEEDTH